MAANGHDCLVLCGGVAEQETVLDGVRIRAIAKFDRNAHRIGEAVIEFDPDFVLVSSEDLSHALLREAHQAAADRLVYLAHTPQWFPFGPEAWNKDESATRLLADALAIVSIGTHMAAYIEEHLGRRAEVVAPDLYGKAPWPEYSNFERKSVLLINPCVVKGLPIFLELAERMPSVKFLALKGWGTTRADEEAMRLLANVEVLDTVQGIDEVFRRTSVLLAPSLWYEGFGLVVTEALLRGIPVLASRHGGLNEAAASSRFRLPVAPIKEWLAQYDETGMPIGVVEPQPVASWEAALHDLLASPDVYAEERATGMEAARAFASKLSANDLESLLVGLQAKRLKILLIHNSTFYPGAGGGDKSNRLLVEALVQEGHQVRVFTRLEEFEHESYLEELARRGVETREWKGIGVSFELTGAVVHVVTRDTNLRKALAEDLAEAAPDIILCSTDDPAHLLYETALQYEGARVVYLVRATIALPFGPDASTISVERSERLREADAVVGVSEYVAKYCRDYGQLDAVHVPISLGDHADPPDVGRFANEFVTLVNPSAVKGLPILLGLADALPETQFAAVPSWGTTEGDRAQIAERKNITVLEAVDDITEILSRTRVTLVPSLWAEARSRMVVESLSRGVPVLASDVGGLREAMCGVEHVLPVNPILRYRSKVSEQMVPEAEVPEQDLAPWVHALRSLLESEARWLELSRRSRGAALAYLSGISVKPLERIFRRSRAASRGRGLSANRALSPVKRKLLALRIARFLAERKKRFFPVSWGTGKKVFLFPWAEAGVQAWSFLRGAMSEGFSLLPALLPGREDRLDEAMARSFAELIPAMTDEIESLLADSENFVFAGHSMGGGLAFEVVRELRRRGKRLPDGLIVSSCTGPRARGIGVASGGLDADRKMFGAHVYAREEALEIPLTVMTGSGEAGLRSEAWEEETRGAFRHITVEGGHFWLLDAPEALALEIEGIFDSNS